MWLLLRKRLFIILSVFSHDIYIPLVLFHFSPKRTLCVPAHLVRLWCWRVGTEKRICWYCQRFHIFVFMGFFFLCHQRCYCPTGHVIRPYIGSLLLVCSARARNSHSRGQKQTPSCHCIWRPAGTSTDAFLCPVRILPTTVSFLPFLSGSWWSYMGQGVHFHPSVNSVPRKTHKFRGALERDVVAPIQTSLKVQRFLLLG